MTLDGQEGSESKRPSLYMKGTMYLVNTTVEDTKEEAQGTFCVGVCLTN